nr:hypothetical protein [Tanacetum cinerariifolium]
MDSIHLALQSREAVMANFELEKKLSKKRDYYNPCLFHYGKVPTYIYFCGQNPTGEEDELKTKADEEAAAKARAEEEDAIRKSNEKTKQKSKKLKERLERN